MKENSKFPFIAVVHLFLMLGVYISPFLLSWKWVLVGIIIYYLQLLVFGNCILTSAQFGSTQREDTFYSYLLGKIGFYPNKRKVIIVVDYVIPWIILLVGIFWQLIFGHHPILF